MGRIIKLQFNDKEYKLEFNRKSLLEIADIKFDEKSIQSNYEGLVKLVKSAFMMHHPEITKDEVESIIASIEDLSGFIGALSQIIQASVDTFNQSKGNAHWEVA